METAQKRAILAILGMIESGIIQLKMLLSVDSVDSHVVAEAPRASAEPTYLSDDEDAMLERQQEAERQQLIAFEKQRAQSLWEMDE